MAFSIPGITQSEYSVIAQGAKAIDQLHPTDPSALVGSSSTSCISIAPDKVERNSTPSSATYDANVLHRVGTSAHVITIWHCRSNRRCREPFRPGFGTASLESCRSGRRCCAFSAPGRR
jgi:hypothetical protein